MLGLIAQGGRLPSHGIFEGVRDVTESHDVMITFHSVGEWQGDMWAPRLPAANWDHQHNNNNRRTDARTDWLCDWPISSVMMLQPVLTATHSIETSETTQHRTLRQVRQLNTGHWDKWDNSTEDTETSETSQHRTLRQVIQLNIWDWDSETTQHRTLRHVRQFNIWDWDRWDYLT